MDAELEQLEHRVEQVLDLCRRLSVGNARLRARIAALEDDNSDLADRISAATQRLEALMEQLPQ